MMLLERLMDFASQFPNKSAVVEDGKATDYRTFVASIMERRRYFAGRFRHGALISLDSQSVVDAWVNAFALRSLGCTTAMIQVPEELRRANFWPIHHVLASSSVSLRDRLRNLLSGVRPVVAPDSLSHGCGGLAQQLPVRAGNFILQSSGTSGKPKYVIYSGAKELALADYIARQFRFNAETVFNFLGLPLWTGVGGKFPLSVWGVGGTCVFDRRSDHIEHLLEFGTTHAYVGLLELQRLGDCDLGCSTDAGSMKLLTGGGPISRGAVEMLADRPGFDAMFGLGSTELAGWSLEVPVKEIHEFPCWMHVSEGRCVEVVDDAGSPSADQVQGTLRFRLKDVDAIGYLGDAAAEKINFKDGFFFPGNCAARHYDGKIQVLGSSGDLITVRGIKQSPAKLEGMVCKICNVDHCLVFSRSDEEGCDELIVVVESGTLPDSNARLLAEAAFPIADRIRWFCMEELPRSHSGLQKIQRTKVRDEILAANTNRD